MTRFSAYHRIKATAADDFFDVDMSTDTALYVDPFKIYDANDPVWAGAHDRMLDFFGMIFGLIRDAKGNEDSLAYKKAKKMLMFPEPAEFCLGLAAGSPLGSGSGRGLQVDMLEGLKTALGIGMDNLEHMEALALFSGGIGFDRLSDAVCNVLKSYFITYTQAVCARHGVPMENFRVVNASWSEKDARWLDLDVELPVNPTVPMRLPVLLTPAAFLRDIPVATSEDFWRYAWSNNSDDLRTDFNYDLARNVGKRERAKMARQHPQIVQNYLTNLEENAHEAYDIVDDPRGIVHGREANEILTSLPPLRVKPDSPAELDAFIREVIDDFRYSLEDSNGWRLFHHLNQVADERRFQVFFQHTARHYAKVADVAMSPESNAGRGPVDFTFSTGATVKTIVELKLMSNTGLLDGVLAQVPTYADAEQVETAYFVAIATEAAHLDAMKIAEVFEAAALATKSTGIAISALVIDATPKTPGSKVKAGAADRAEVRRSTKKDQRGAAAA